MVPENERAALIQHYINTQRAERERDEQERERDERERDERERERDERERDERERELGLVPESQRAALLIAREKTKQMKLERGRPTTSKSREGTSYLTIFIITIDTV